MTVALVGWLVAGLSAATLVGSRMRARRRDVLLARAAHELRGPLQAVMLGVSGLGRTPREDPASRVQSIEDELRRVVVALGDLDAARAGRDPAPSVGTGVDLTLLLRRQVDAWAPAAARRGRELQLAGAARPYRVDGDPARLAQATGNLIANALDHGRGTVVVTLGEGHRGTILVEVRDDGPGLPVPLRRLVLRAARARGAHGHGLAVAAEVARRHGGRLGTAPGPSGYGVVLELPVAAGWAAVA